MEKVSVAYNRTVCTSTILEYNFHWMRCDMMSAQTPAVVVMA